MESILLLGTFGLPLVDPHQRAVRGLPDEGILSQAEAAFRATNLPRALMLTNVAAIVDPHSDAPQFVGPRYLDMIAPSGAGDVPDASVVARYLAIDDFLCWLKQQHDVVLRHEDPDAAKRRLEAVEWRALAAEFYRISRGSISTALIEKARRLWPSVPPPSSKTANENG